MKLKNLSALQDQTPNPQNEEAAYLRYPLKSKDLMTIVYINYLHPYKLHTNNMIHISCVMRMDYKPVDFTKIKCNTRSTF